MRKVCDLSVIGNEFDMVQVSLRIRACASQTVEPTTEMHNCIPKVQWLILPVRSQHSLYRSGANVHWHSNSQYRKLIPMWWAKQRTILARKMLNGRTKYLRASSDHMQITWSDPNIPWKLGFYASFSLDGTPDPKGNWLKATNIK